MDKQEASKSFSKTCGTIQQLKKNAASSKGFVGVQCVQQRGEMEAHSPRHRGLRFLSCIQDIKMRGSQVKILGFIIRFSAGRFWRVTSF